MSRTRRKFPPYLRKEDYTDSGEFITRGQCSLPKLKYSRGVDQVWHPKAKKFRKKLNTRKMRRQNGSYNGE